MRFPILEYFEKSLEEKSGRMRLEHGKDVSFFLERMEKFEDSLPDLIEHLINMKLGDKDLFAFLYAISSLGFFFVHRLFMSPNTQLVKKFLNFSPAIILHAINQVKDENERNPYMIFVCFQNAELCRQYLDLIGVAGLKIIQYLKDKNQISALMHTFMKQTDEIIIHFFKIKGKPSQKEEDYNTGLPAGDLNDRTADTLLYIYRDEAAKFHMENQSKEGFSKSLRILDRWDNPTSRYIELCQPNTNRDLCWSLCPSSIYESIQDTFRIRRKIAGEILSEIPAAQSEEYRTTAIMILKKMLRSYYVIGLSMPCDLAYFQKNVLSKTDCDYLSNAIVIGLSFEKVKVSRKTEGFENAITNLDELKQYVDSLKASEKQERLSPLYKRLKIFHSLLDEKKHSVQWDRMKSILDVIGPHVRIPSLSQLCLLAQPKLPTQQTAAKESETQTNSIRFGTGLTCE